MDYKYDSIKVLPSEIDSDLDNTILSKLKNKIGDKCNVYGFIKKDSIVIHNKSKPKIISAHFDGSLYYKIEYTADIINPKKESSLNCKIIKKNKHGILANNSCIYVVIPYVFNNINYYDKLNKFNIHDNINVIIKNVNYDINDNQINVFGIIDTS